MRKIARARPNDPDSSLMDNKFGKENRNVMEHNI